MVKTNEVLHPNTFMLLFHVEEPQAWLLLIVLMGLNDLSQNSSKMGRLYMVQQTNI